MQKNQKLDTITQRSKINARSLHHQS